MILNKIKINLMYNIKRNLKQKKTTTNFKKQIQNFIKEKNKMLMNKMNTLTAKEDLQILIKKSSKIMNRAKVKKERLVAL